MADDGSTDTVKILVGGFMIFQTIAGLFGNSVIIRMFWKFKQLRTPSNNLLLFLSVANLGMCLCIPFSTASTFAGHWVFDTSGCKFYGFASMFFGLSVIGILTCLSIDRYIVVCRRSLASMLTQVHYNYMSLTAYVNALFWAIMPVFGWARYEEDPGSGCALDWNRRGASYISYLFTLFVINFLVPLVVMVTCFGRAHAVMVKREQVHAASSDNDLTPINSDWANQKQVTMLGVALIVVFLFTWSPFAIICIWGAIGDPHNVPYWFAVIAPFAAKWSQVLNPLMFVMFIKRFRDYTLVILCCKTHVETIELTQQTTSDQQAVERAL
ncbi:visual pigment-like receptor peropsin [Asterias amurensis]|uniref:visual pigment-like receptor peropsin n=1 Tax=Asterias amurensis TaxID=7602 RepID=UPI003AB1CF5C